MLPRIPLLIVLLAVEMAMSGGAWAQNIAGRYLHVRDSDGSHPKKGATVALTFAGGNTGTLKLLAVQPGETVDDSGTYSLQGNRITIHFQEMEWSADRQPVQFDGCTLILPFMAVSSRSGPGTSTWQKQDAKCPEQPTTPGSNPSATRATSSQVAANQARDSSFSAEEVTTRGRQSGRARIWSSELGLRAERDESGQPSITILRRDRNLLWTLSPQTRTYAETPFDYGASNTATQLDALEPGCQVAGQETVSGFLCRKEVCRTTAGGREYTETRWSAQELSWFIIRYTRGTSTMLLENVKPGPQDPRLFEIPAGYRKRAQ